jgi:hypothetical protein
MSSTKATTRPVTPAAAAPETVPSPAASVLPKAVNPAVTVLQTAINQRRAQQRELVSRLGSQAGQAEASYQEADREARLLEHLLGEIQTPS